MKERPIMFTAGSVRAILSGRKTQTRRVATPQPSFPFGVSKIVLVPGPFHNEAFTGTPAAGMGTKGPRALQWYCEDYCGNLVARWTGRCPHGIPGDRLWVRESMRWANNGGEPRECGHVYSATPDDWVEPLYGTKPLRTGKTIIGRYMPRWASRILLEITEVHCERVQDISQDDAVAEGCPPTLGGEYCVDFMLAWDLINNKRGFGWDKNPWVWAITFKIVSPDGVAKAGVTS